MRNSLEILEEAQGETVLVSVEMEVNHADLLENQAAVENAVLEHGNAVAKEKGERQVAAKVKWSRKEIASQFLKAQCNDYATRLAEQVKACGPIPDSKDEKAVAAYATKVFDWRNKKLNRG